MIILFIGYFTFLYLNKNSDSKLVQESTSNKIDKSLIKNKILEKSQEASTILELYYKSNDEKGNIYQIKSESGSIDDANENILILTNVTAEILVFNYGTFFIESDKAKYNKLSLDTHFFNNVNLLYFNHIIKSEDLFLKYIDKEIKISNNVKYKNKENFLEADEVDLDLVSKTSKIYMKNKNQKVKAIIRN
tara:strand:- start:594 stop:1166 length:573 start_codon:yes stop_codon:yes gene_type:complete